MDERTIHPEVVEGDPFPYAGGRPHACLDGWVFVGHLADDGEEHIEAIRCRRCAEDQGRS